MDYESLRKHLSRVPSQTELPDPVAAYLNAAKSGPTGLSAYRDAEVTRMFEGQEYCTNQIKALYERLLDRVPNSSEIEPAVATLASGAALQSFTARFCSGGEFIGDHPLPTAYTNTVFQLLLNRAPSDFELSTMVAALQSGNTTPEKLCTQFIQSSEFCNALLNDMFQTFLKRAPTSTEIATREPLLAGGIAQQVVSAGLANCQEYLNNCTANAASRS